ncbi:hypothetical protein L228DRAFT_235376 [Xylona heveae TC161]|uniref:Uncharacterized protein n=1 Tax=Xylona heveae (strain CBS 132557 / TC161) TaxID=1328760 RepID=A0A165JIG5_XYLHT|nr:hypothetical protein L228DRAFT_235376 [Xylona heveae TC161]KZF26282.1 hypothetical protein L228DRAFT_235376 [Xylona heveae TC161]
MDTLQAYISRFQSIYTTTSSLYALPAQIARAGNSMLGFLTSHARDFDLNLTSLALLLVILFMSLKILDMLRRAVMYWVRMAFRMVFWTVVVSVVILIWTHGVEDTLRVLGEIGGFLQGLAAVLVEQFGVAVSAAEQQQQRQYQQRTPQMGYSRQQRQ